MATPYPVKAIANLILDKAFASKKPITPLKLQKLLYYAHGYFSGAYGEPLLDEPFEAWQYGPVVPSIYQEFKHFGNTAINRLAAEMDWDTDERIPVVLEIEDRRVHRVIDYVWKTFSDRSPLMLSQMTHRPGSPWEKTIRDSRGIKHLDIDQKEIETYFKPLTRKKGEAAAAA